MTEELDTSTQGECIIERGAGAYVGLLLPVWTYEQLQKATKVSHFANIELVRKALDHYLDHWTGLPVPANAHDAELDIDHESYRDIDTWVMELLGEDHFERPPATIGVHFDGDEIAALLSVLDMDHNESSIDFVRSAVLDQIARRQALHRPATPSDLNTEAAS